MEVTAGLGFGAVVVVALRTVVDGAARAVAGVGLTVVVVVVGSVVVGGGRVVSGSVVGGALVTVVSETTEMRSATEPERPGSPPPMKNPSTAQRPKARTIQPRW